MTPLDRAAVLLADRRKGERTTTTWARWPLTLAMLTTTPPPRSRVCGRQASMSVTAPTTFTSNACRHVSGLAWQQALTIFEEVGAPQAAVVRARLR